VQPNPLGVDELVQSLVLFFGRLSNFRTLLSDLCVPMGGGFFIISRPIYNVRGAYERIQCPSPKFRESFNAFSTLYRTMPAPAPIARWYNSVAVDSALLLLTLVLAPKALALMSPRSSLVQRLHMHFVVEQ